MKYVIFIGRLLFSMIFILASLGHFSSDAIQYAAREGVPLPQLFIPVTGVIALLGGISILLGFKARLGAWLIVLFIIPTTFFMHKFWRAQDPMVSTMQQVMFLKNLALLGGALVIAYFGSGPLSLESIKMPFREKRSSKKRK